MMNPIYLQLALCVLALSSLAQAAATRSTSLIFFSEPNFSGETVTLDPAELANSQCVNLPSGTKVGSIAMNAEFGCCVLYRTPCTPMVSHSQSPFFLNMRVYNHIRDLVPYGFSNITRSVVCPSKDMCQGIRSDMVDSPNGGFVGKYWVDILHLYGKEAMFDTSSS